MTPADVPAAGAVLWREADGGVEVALVHRPRYDDWSLPKGKLDVGESPAAAAVREVAEETGLRAVLGRALGSTSYRVPEGTKSVRYWAARVAGGRRFRPTGEVDELRWLPPGEAVELLDYPHDRELVEELVGCPVHLRTLLLVRHGKAGRRAEWHGPDAGRPLSKRGRRQAEGLAALLPLFGAERVHSAPPLRCVQTVEPLAHRLGVPVVEEPLLSEDGYWAEPPAALWRLRQIVGAPSTAVVCSQGGAIPDLLAELAGAAGGARLSGPDGALPPARKGSAWVLSFDGERLVAADYHPDPFD